eukprot:s2005_g12.t3
MRLRPSPNENELELQSQRCYVRELDFEVRNCYNMPRMMAELLQHGHSIKCAVFEVNCLTSPLRELLSPLLHLWPVPSMHRLHMILEELQSFAWNRRRQKAFPEAEHLSASIAEVPGTQFVDDSGKDHKIASASDTASPAFAPCTAEVEVQAELEFSDSLQALRRRALMQEIDDIRIEKALVERRAARELKDLEALVLNLDRQLQSRRAESTKVAKQEAAEAEPWRGDLDEAVPSVPADVQSEWFAAQKVEFHDISSDGEEDVRRSRAPLETEAEEEPVEAPAGLVFVQRIAELEMRSDELKQQLEELHHSESALRKENQEIRGEKNDLIAVLLRKAKLPESKPAGSARSAPGGHWWSQASQRSAQEDIQELERIVEDTTEDNIRLRNDIKIMSDELRKVMDVQPTKVEKSHRTHGVALGEREKITLLVPTAVLC